MLCCRFFDSSVTSLESTSSVSAVSGKGGGIQEQSNDQTDRVRSRGMNGRGETTRREALVSLQRVNRHEKLEVTQSLFGLQNGRRSGAVWLQSATYRVTGRFIRLTLGSKLKKENLNKQID